MQLKHFLIKHSLKWVIIVSLLTSAGANPDAKRLYDDLLSNYNRLIRPVRIFILELFLKYWSIITQVRRLDHWLWANNEPPKTLVYLVNC